MEIQHLMKFKETLKLENVWLMYVSVPHRWKVLIVFIKLHVAFTDFYLRFRCFHEFNEVFISIIICDIMFVTYSVM